MRKLATEPGDNLSPAAGPGAPAAPPSPSIALAATPACGEVAPASQATEPRRLHKWPQGHSRRPA